MFKLSLQTPYLALMGQGNLSSDISPWLSPFLGNSFSSSTLLPVLPTTSASALPTETVYVNNPSTIIALAIPLGVSLLGFSISLGIFSYLYKKTKKTPSTSQQDKNLPGLLVQDFGLQTKNNELGSLIQQTKNKIGSNLAVTLETLLDTQAEITKGNNTYTLRQTLREAKEKLQSKLSLEEINNLCRLQSEAIQEQQEQELQVQIEARPLGAEVRNLGRE